MNHRITIPVACLLALAGCGGSKEGAATATAPTATASSPTAPGAATAAANKSTVAAVREGSGNAAVRVRFLLDKPPVVDQETQVRVDFNSYISGPVTVDVDFAGDQLQLAPEAMKATISLPRSGEDVTHMLAVTPKVVGLSDLKVHLRIAGEEAGAEGGAEATYVIPILADQAGSDKSGPAREANHANP